MVAAAEQSSRITLTPGVVPPTSSLSAEWTPERVFSAAADAFSSRAHEHDGGPPRRNPLNLVLVGVVIAGIFAGAYHQLDGRTAQLERQQQWMIFAIEAIARATGAELPSKPPP